MTASYLPSLACCQIGVVQDKAMMLAEAQVMKAEKPPGLEPEWAVCVCVCFSSSPSKFDLGQR